jgi:hypothetical protein
MEIPPNQPLQPIKTPETNLDNLPRELLGEVLSRLSKKDIESTSLATKPLSEKTFTAAKTTFNAQIQESLNLLVTHLAVLPNKMSQIDPSSNSNPDIVRKKIAMITADKILSSVNFDQLTEATSSLIDETAFKLKSLSSVNLDSLALSLKKETIPPILNKILEIALNPSKESFRDSTENTYFTISNYLMQKISEIAWSIFR